MISLINDTSRQKTHHDPSYLIHRLKRTQISPNRPEGTAKLLSWEYRTSLNNTESTLLLTKINTGMQENFQIISWLVWQPRDKKESRPLTMTHSQVHEKRFHTKKKKELEVSIESINQFRFIVINVNKHIGERKQKLSMQKKIFFILIKRKKEKHHNHEISSPCDG